LENAIEAASLSDDKKITLSIYFQKGVLYIDVSNTYGDKPFWQSGKLITHKRGYNHHGIGLRSVESMVKRLNGILEYQHDEKIFRVLIMLYIE
jgi:sensor histidine kinase regulating citrate/malate metabolism